MRLLILTQKVDQNDDILGFFHTWLISFSEQFEKITVICLFEGEHSLPANVRVLSLGKNEGKGRLTYIRRFFSYIRRERKEYDKVFIHMNPEYLALGSFFWAFFGKEVYLWFNHPRGNVWVKLFKSFAKKIFCTSQYAFATQYRKTVLMPAGIDTTVFKNAREERKKETILVLGRLSPVKRLHVLDPALRLLKDAQFSFSVSVYGDAPPQDKKYAATWKEGISDLVESNLLTLHEAVPNTAAPALYNAHEIYVNLTPTGSFDKTILEAMSCGAIPIVANKSFEHILPEKNIFKEDDHVDLADTIKAQLEEPQHEIDRLARKLELYVEHEQSLNALTKKLVDELETR